MRCFWGMWVERRVLLTNMGLVYLPRQSRFPFTVNLPHSSLATLDSILQCLLVECGPRTPYRKQKNNGATFRVWPFSRDIPKLISIFLVCFDFLSRLNTVTYFTSIPRLTVLMSWSRFAVRQMTPGRMKYMRTIFAPHATSKSQASKNAIGGESFAADTSQHQDINAFNMYCQTSEPRITRRSIIHIHQSMEVNCRSSSWSPTSSLSPVGSTTYTVCFEKEIHITGRVVFVSGVKPSEVVNSTVSETRRRTRILETWE